MGKKSTNRLDSPAEKDQKSAAMNPATATTSLNQVPALHKFVATLGLSVFDYGAGKKGKIDAFYASLKLPRVYLPFDPFNRTREENEASIKYLEDFGVDIVTCSNVLNILEDWAMVNFIRNLAETTKETFKGVCLVSVYHKPSMPCPMPRKGYVQRNQPIAAYVKYLEKDFTKVQKLGKFLVCSTH